MKVLDYIFLLKGKVFSDELNLFNDDNLLAISDDGEVTFLLISLRTFWISLIYEHHLVDFVGCYCCYHLLSFVVC